MNKHCTGDKNMSTVMVELHDVLGNNDLNYFLSREKSAAFPVPLLPFLAVFGPVPFSFLITSFIVL
jgi:hypothetical protein